MAVSWNAPDGLQHIPFDPMYTPEVVKAVATLLKQGEDSGEKVGALEEVLRTCRAAGIVWDGHIVPEQVGVHTENTSKFGAGGTDAQHLGDRILVVGFS